MGNNVSPSPIGHMSYSISITVRVLVASILLWPRMLTDGTTRFSSDILVCPHFIKDTVLQGHCFLNRSVFGIFRRNSSFIVSWDNFKHFQFDMFHAINFISVVCLNHCGLFSWTSKGFKHHVLRNSPFLITAVQLLDHREPLGLVLSGSTLVERGLLLPNTNNWLVEWERRSLSWGCCG